MRKAAVVIMFAAVHLADTAPDTIFNPIFECAGALLQAREPPGLLVEAQKALKAPHRLLEDL